MLKPKYLRLVEVLEGMIVDKAPGEPIPSERDLAAQHRLSRMTVRKAIDHLVRRGRLYRVKNVGTFIAPNHPSWNLMNLLGFTKEALAMGSRPENEVLAFRTLKAGERFASRLRIAEEDAIQNIVRLRKIDADPVMVDESYFPESLVPLSRDSVEGSIYDHIEKKLGLRVAGAEHSLRAAKAPAAYCRHLGLKGDEPLLVIELTGFLQDGRVFEFTKSYVDTRRYTFLVSSQSEGRMSDDRTP